MPNAFHTRIRSALADSNLQAALDANAERRIRVRREAFAALPLEDMRQRAHAVRADVIANLDRYLAQFISRVEANGVIVHRAATAKDAVQIILDIASQSHRIAPTVIAKSKTMVSEEIHLNPALEAAGMRVVETDLGEYIVQLRDEPPAHIITPAVHLRRGDVAKLFHEKLGMPLTDDIPTMTNLARRVLRDVFLTADVGLSGVNFGVAETGTLTVVTNEGNGRMVTTVPKVHIALMGMERLVPTFDDLALMLALLPRSATGQKLSVYVSLLHSPRRADDPDGPQERHLVLLDNGRSALRGSPLEEILYCIRCGACLNACPVFREIGGHAYASAYPGPMGSVLSPGLFGTPEFGQLARASTLCGACKDACPVDIDLPKLLLRVRAGCDVETSRRDVSTRRGVSTGVNRPNAPGYLKWGLRFFSVVASNPWLYRMAQRLAGIGGKMVAPRSGWLRLPAITGWGYSKDFPAPAVRPFTARVHHRDAEITEKENFSQSRIHAPSGRSGAEQPASTSQPPDCHPAEANTNLLPATLIERFANELTALGGEFTACREDELAGKLVALLRERGVSQIVAWETGLPAGLLDTLRENGILAGPGPHPMVKIGLTGALAAVAETGTLVIPGGPGRPLTASLLPEVHIAVLREADIYENLAQALSLSEVREVSALALVSGPSRTADIEMTLTIGVHGPGEVHVICI